LPFKIRSIFRLIYNMIPDEGIVASEIEAGLSYATISGAEILPNIGIKRS